MSRILSSRAAKSCQHSSLNSSNLRKAIYNDKTLFPTQFELTGAYRIEPKSNLQEADLRSQNLRDVNLRGANLTHANLEFADLTGANLQETILTNAVLNYTQLQHILWNDITQFPSEFILTEVAYSIEPGSQLQNAILKDKDLQNVNLQGANLQKANLYGANLTKADLREANLQGTVLRRVNFQGANLQGLNLAKRGLQNIRFKEANLQKANFRNAELQYTVFQGAILVEANLSNANLKGADLSEANLQKANLCKANLRGANLQEALFQDTKLSGAIIDKTTLISEGFIFGNDVYQLLPNANLRKAALQGLKLSGIDLQGANLQEANLSKANLSLVNLEKAQLIGANLKNTKLCDAKLQAANLQGADLQGADFYKANLEKANLVGANLRNAKLQYADLSYATLPPKKILEQEANLNLDRAKLEGCIFVTTEEHELSKAEKKLSSKKVSRPKSSEEAKEQIRLTIAYRRGQDKFRTALLQEFQYRCVITGCDAEAALEAAHIIPYCETEDNDSQNGLLLRADIHTLFDLHLIAIDPSSMTVELHPSIANTSPYNQLVVEPFRWEMDADLHSALVARKEALEERFREFRENM